MTDDQLCRNRADIDLRAVAHNVGLLRSLAPESLFCAVVKADGYGHGSVEVAHAALDAGADWLGVAHASEARTLVESGIGSPIMLLSDPRAGEIDTVVRYRLRATVSSVESAVAISRAVVEGEAEDEPVQVHLKINTGMNRIGAATTDAVETARAISALPGVELEGVLTHLAVADDPGNPETDRQLGRYREVLDALAAAGIDPPIKHAANSAGTIDYPESHFDLVRCGIAIYGIDPSPDMGVEIELRPAMTLRAEVSMVKEVQPGERVSYGLRHEFDTPTTVATVAIGYADGVPRRHWADGDLLIRGRRRPIVGVVTMDQLMVDCGRDVIEVGDEAVLIGTQGDETISAEEWALELDTIAYEIVCGISKRVPRRYVT